MKKRIIISTIVLVILVLVGGLFLHRIINKENGGTRPIYFVPSDAIYIVETNEPINAWNSIRENPLWVHLLKNKTFKELSSGLGALDEIVNENQIVFDLLGSRKLLVSAHMYKHNDYDFLYLIDAENKIETSFLETALKKSIDKSIYNLTSRKYKTGHTILELYDKEYRETLYLSSYDNVIIVSYINKLVEKSIEEYESPKIGRDINYIEVTNKLEVSDYFNIYVNYESASQFVNLFLEEEENNIVNEITQSLFYTGFSFELEDEGNVSLEGVSTINDTINTFLNALNKSGNGESNIHKIAPDITAFYMSLGFDNFQEFIDNFEKTYKQADEEGFKAYQKNNQKIERFVGINLKKHFYSWIDDEIAYLQLQSGGLGSNNEFAFIFKTNDVDKANEQLDFIKRKIKKNTPGRFKSVAYKGYVINYLSIKGFFKALMGKFFSKLEKPYYVVVNDYVIFSNHPQTLRIIIDRLEEGKVLGETEYYQKFASTFSNKNNVMCYMHMSKLFTNLLDISESETKKELQQNKEFITCFEQVGFQMINDDDNFMTTLKSTFKDPNQIVIEENLNFKSLENLNFEVHQPSKQEEDLFYVEPIYLEDLDVKKHESYFDNDILKIEVDIKDGMKHGVYKQYYDDGTLMLKGHYEDDLKEGTWKFYNKEGKVVEKRFYSKGEIEE